MRSTACKSANASSISSPAPKNQKKLRTSQHGTQACGSLLPPQVLGRFFSVSVHLPKSLRHRSSARAALKHRCVRAALCCERCGQEAAIVRGEREERMTTVKRSADSYRPHRQWKRFVATDPFRSSGSRGRRRSNLRNRTFRNRWFVALFVDTDPSVQIGQGCDCRRP